MLVPNGPTYIYFFLHLVVKWWAIYKAKSEMQICLFPLNHKIEKFKIITVALGQMERFICIGNYE